ncbi:MAG: MMPL family protein, partial [Desulfobulbaceae bacterium]
MTTIHNKKMFNYRLLLLVAILICSMAGIGLLRLDIDTDVVRSLPADNTVISDALEIFTNHPIHDQIAIDIMVDRDAPDILVECAVFFEEKLQASGLFAEVGIRDVGKQIPELALHIANNLPLFFSQSELEQEIAPRLTKERIEQRLNEVLQKLSSLEGIGQSDFIAADPLGLMEPVMAKMAMLAPSPELKMYKGHLLSADKRHLLVTARPITAGTDTASAQQISTLLTTIAQDLSHKYSPQGVNITVTPVGAYRAALDNERIIRHDVRLALLLSTAGIGLLLFFAFPRPLLGLFSLLPAFAGTAAALLVFSLFHPSISIMVLGFGGAIISITVDHGIAYLLFLDRPQKTKGKEASREVYSVGILTVLTTIGAFLILCLSGFPIFVPLGQFTAMGVLFSFLFIHTIFPRLTPSMPPSRVRALPLQWLVDRLYSTGRIGAVAAALL